MPQDSPETRHQARLKDAVQRDKMVESTVNAALYAIEALKRFVADLEQNRDARLAASSGTGGVPLGSTLAASFEIRIHHPLKEGGKTTVEVISAAKVSDFGSDHASFKHSSEITPE